jgi:transposase
MDILLAKHGHSVIWLPPYYLDLNPIELVWNCVKEYVTKRNITLKFDGTNWLVNKKLIL